MAPADGHGFGVLRLSRPGCGQLVDALSVRVVVPPDPPTFQAISLLESDSDEATTELNIEVEWPDHDTNDISILLVSARSTDADAPDIIVSGWTLVFEEDTTTGGDGARMAVYWKRAASAAESVAAVIAQQSANVGLGVQAQMLTVRGGITSGDPIHTSRVTSGSGSACFVSADTTTLPNTLLVIASANFSDATHSNWGSTLISMTVHERADGGAGLGFGTGTVTSAGTTG